MDWIKDLLTSKILYGWLFGLTMFGALAIFVMDTWIMPAYTHYNEGLTVPDVTKISLEEAEEILESYGLRYEILDRRAHSAYPADYILDQAPPAKHIVKPNRKIYLTVNTAVRPTTVVPDVVNMSLRNAQIQIENYGLSVGTISYESGRFRATVLRQSVSPGDTVDVETTIDLAVSDGLGDTLVEVPDIIGLTLAEAQQVLREAGLRVSEIRYEPSQEAQPHTILSREPEDRELQEGESLSLVVSERFDTREEEESGVFIPEEDSVELDNNDFEQEIEEQN
ncbi:MAG: PASTA domain-containing protein [Balneolaceae bacterium]